MFFPRLYNREATPWTELERLHEQMNELLGSFQSGRGQNVLPAVNIYTNNDTAVVMAELPGVDPDDLDVNVQNDTVTLRGNRNREEPGENEKYLRQERLYGNFARTFALPFQVDADNVKAKYRNGVLELELPRAEEDKPKRVNVERG